MIDNNFFFFWYGSIPFRPDMHGKVTCLYSKEDEILALPLDDVSQPLDLNISTSPLKKI